MRFTSKRWTECRNFIACRKRGRRSVFPRPGRAKNKHFGTRIHNAKSSIRMPSICSPATTTSSKTSCSRPSNSCSRRSSSTAIWPCGSRSSMSSTGPMNLNSSRTIQLLTPTLSKGIPLRTRKRRISGRVRRWGCLTFLSRRRRTGEAERGEWPAECIKVGAADNEWLSQQCPHYIL